MAIDNELIDRLDVIGVDTSYATCLSKENAKDIRLIILRNSHLGNDMLCWMVNDYLNGVFTNMINNN